MLHLLPAWTLKTILDTIIDHNEDELYMMQSRMTSAEIGLIDMYRALRAHERKEEG
jgi:hypothetical protein